MIYLWIKSAKKLYFYTINEDKDLLNNFGLLSLKFFVASQILSSAKYLEI